ncbi:MAG: zinc ribbon domain-containing protein [Deltaproteobacteria bacterium]
MATMEFTRNYTDHSNQDGFQFEFFCDKCGNGVRSAFAPNKLGIATELLGAASNLFGGMFGGAAGAGARLQDAMRGPAWDKAFQGAIAECRPRFRQCGRCGQWVCPEICWNGPRGLCESCAPDLNKEASAAQASAAVAQIQTKAQESDQTSGLDVTAFRAGSCPHCNARVDGGKFCPSCGKSLSTRSACGSCGAQIAEGAKFCPECGKPRA